jgi:oligo-1,6-glucosidase
VYDLMRFWLDKGVDGFRMDVINLISKTWGADGRSPDAPVQRPGFLQSGFDLTANGPRLLEFLGEMRREVLDHYTCITVGECPGVSLEVARAITHQDAGTLNMVFQFDHMSLDQQSGQSKWALKDLDLCDLKQSLTHWQLALADGGWNSLYFNNHDQPRVVSRFGNDGPWRVPAAKMLATALHGMQGTPYVYQGEEIGMTNYPFERIEQCQDIETLNMYNEAVDQRGEDPAVVMRAIRTKGRDNARTPMQWTPGPQAGFTSGQPWLAVNPNHDQINAQQAQADAGSVFHHYRHLIGLRRSNDTLVHGRYQALWPDHPQLMAYTRTLGHEQILVLCNFSDQPLQQPLGGLSLSGAVVLCANWPVDDSLSPVVDGAVLTLRPYEALMLQTRQF